MRIEKALIVSLVAIALVGDHRRFEPVCRFLASGMALATGCV